MTVYPNPTSDYFNVAFTQQLEGEYDWKLIDVAGRILQTGTAQKGTQLDLNSYFLIPFEIIIGIKSIQKVIKPTKVYV